MGHLLKTNPRFRIPTNFYELRALYWGIQRIVDAIADGVNMSKTADTEQLIEGDGAATDALRKVQQAVAAAVRVMPGADLEFRAQILIHWECECGLETPGRLLDLAELLRELAAQAAPPIANPLAIAAE